MQGDAFSRWKDSLGGGRLQGGQVSNVYGPFIDYAILERDPLFCTLLNCVTNVGSPKRLFKFDVKIIRIKLQS